jgi:2-C-methyl-D-erythritol 4-phosphate cytidylyltransferase
MLPSAPLDTLAIVVVGAGASTRMGFDKVWADLGGQPLIAWTLAAARQAQPAELVLVVAEGRLEDARRLAPDIHVCAGGARRRDSVASGLAATSAPWVAIHDAARALVPPQLFADGLVAARQAGTAIPALAVKDTIKRVADGVVTATLPRDELVAVQTPQVFQRGLLERALASTAEDVTDEARLIEQLGGTVAVFTGHEENFKVTTPLDFALATLLVQRRQVS